MISFADGNGGEEPAAQYNIVSVVQTPLGNHIVVDHRDPDFGALSPEERCTPQGLTNYFRQRATTTLCICDSSQNLTTKRMFNVIWKFMKISLEPDSLPNGLISFGRTTIEKLLEKDSLDEIHGRAEETRNDLLRQIEGKEAYGDLKDRFIKPYSPRGIMEAVIGLAYHQLVRRSAEDRLVHEETWFAESFVGYGNSVVLTSCSKEHPGLYRAMVYDMSAQLHEPTVSGFFKSYTHNITPRIQGTLNFSEEAVKSIEDDNPVFGPDHLSLDTCLFHTPDGKIALWTPSTDKP